MQFLNVVSRSRYSPFDEDVWEVDPKPVDRQQSFMDRGLTPMTSPGYAAGVEAKLFSLDVMIYNGFVLMIVSCFGMMVSSR